MTIHTRVPCQPAWEARCFRVMQWHPRTKREYDSFAVGTVACSIACRLRLEVDESWDPYWRWYRHAVSALFTNNFDDMPQGQEINPGIDIWRRMASVDGELAAIRFLMEFQWESFFPNGAMQMASFEIPTDEDERRALLSGATDFRFRPATLGAFDFYFSGCYQFFSFLASTSGMQPRRPLLQRYLMEVSAGRPMPVSPLSEQITSLALEKGEDPYDFFLRTWIAFLQTQA